MNDHQTPDARRARPGPLESLSAALDEIVSVGLLQARWVVVIEMLLRFVAENRPDPSSWELPTGYPFDDAAGAAQAISGSVERAVGELVSNDMALGFAAVEAREALRDVVQAEFGRLDVVLPSDLAAAVAAHAAAEALDGLFAESLTDTWRAEGELRIRPGTLFPRPPRDLRQWAGNRSLSTPPSSLQSRSQDHTASLAVAGPHFSDYSVVLDFSLWTALLPVVTGPLVAATVHPTVNMADFDTDEIDDPGPMLVNRGPRDAPGTRRIARRLITAAAGQGAGVVVLPEYALTDHEYEIMVGDLCHDLSSPVVLVTGMASGDEDGLILNEAALCVFTPGGGFVPVRERHRKLFAARIGDREEQITAGTQVRVMATATCSLAVLICRDVMIESVSRLIADLGTSLYLVPVMTPKTATMVQMFSGLAGAAQTFTVLANGPLLWDLSRAEEFDRVTPERSEAVFVAPLASQDGVVHCPPPRTSARPRADSVGEAGPSAHLGALASERGFWLHRFDSRDLRWVSEGSLRNH